MFGSVKFVLSLILCVSCDWVEIVPILSDKESSTSFGDFNTPNLKTVDFTTISTTTPTSILRENNLPKPKFHASSNNVVNKNVTTEKEFGTNIKGGKGDFNLNPNGFLQFLQTVQENLLHYKLNGHKNKMAVLKHLRDQLLANIHTRIKNLWQPPSDNEAREYKDEDYHMDFPSNEGALMTIGFLTFAVFLIKLVIKLVHALKYKKQYYYGTSTTTTTTAASVIFAKRDVSDEIVKISKLIDEYKLPVP